MNDTPDFCDHCGETPNRCVCAVPCDVDAGACYTDKSGVVHLCETHANLYELEETDE